MDPIESGEVCKIEITGLITIFTLEDVSFGDVWFCSGQSNMGWAMKGSSVFKDDVFLRMPNFQAANGEKFSGF